VAAFQERISEPQTRGLGGYRYEMWCNICSRGVCTYITIYQGWAWLWKEYKGQSVYGVDDLIIQKYPRLPENCDYSTRPNFQLVCGGA